MPIRDDLVHRAAAVLARRIKERKNSKLTVGEAIDVLGGGLREYDNLDPDDAMELVAKAMAFATPTLVHAHQATNQAQQNQPVAPTIDCEAVTAPYRFVTLPDQVASGNAVKLNTPLTNGYCATIKVRWEAETPLLVGEAQGNTISPMTWPGTQDWFIPGATFRGLIRSAVEIIAHGRLGASNLHHRYGVRDFEHPYYVNVSRVDKAKAGWLTWHPVGQETPQAYEWLLTPDIEWAHLKIADLLASNICTLRSGTRWSNQKLPEKYATVNQVNGNNTFDFSPHELFSKRTMVSGHQNEARRYETTLNGQEPGVFVFSGKLPVGGNKTYEYVFFEPQSPRPPIQLDASAIELFERLNCKPSRNRPEPDGAWKDLRPTLVSGGRIPVFYVGTPNEPDFAMGLTRLFKMPHRNSVGAVLAKQPAHLPMKSAADADFVENLFGFVEEPDAERGHASPQSLARKGRVAFSFSRIPSSAAKLAGRENGAPIPMVLATPRASFAPFYLRGAAKGVKDYASDGVFLAGRKRYVPRRAAAESFVAAFERLRRLAAASCKPANVNLQSMMRFLVPATGQQSFTFDSTIRLHNVTAAELGAVLFALTHGGASENPYRHMIGHAKPFGAGQVRVVSADLDIMPNFDSPKTGADHKPFLQAFIDHMRISVAPTFPDVPAVQEWLGSCDPENFVGQDRRLAYQEVSTLAKIRKNVKPRKDNAAVPEKAYQCDMDGRLLPAPKTTRQGFWTKG